MTDLLFVRHGETRGNALGTWQGWSDPPLNSTGQAQAHAVAERLTPERGRIGALYTSPLRRSLETAQVIGEQLDLEPQAMDQLKEIHFGRLEGTSLADMEDQFPKLYAQWQDRRNMAFQWPGGERRLDFFERAAKACDQILALHRNDVVVIVSHGGTIRACLAHLVPDRMGEWWTYNLDNAGLSRVVATENGFDVLALNDTAHLPRKAGQSALE
ncbi:MAG: histidine phosphatase family protein [Anaerolineae bacterium]|jgi:broad specificity phosphatase PhoE